MSLKNLSWRRFCVQNGAPEKILSLQDTPANSKNWGKLLWIYSYSIRTKTYHNSDLCLCFCRCLKGWRYSVSVRKRSPSSSWCVIRFSSMSSRSSDVIVSGDSPKEYATIFAYVTIWKPRVGLSGKGATCNDKHNTLLCNNDARARG